MARERFLLIREIGAGLWNELHHILTQLLAAEIVRRIPVVYWGKGSLYFPADSINAFEEFFMPVSGVSACDLASDEFSFYPYKWNSGNILTVPDYTEKDANVLMKQLEQCSADVFVSDSYTSAEEIIPFIPEDHWLFGLGRTELFRRLIRRYIRLNEKIRELVDKFYDKNMKGTPLLAVHVRSSDKITEVRHLHELNEKYHAEIERVLEKVPGIRVFLMTDCIEVLDEYRKRYGSLLIFTDCRRVPKNGPGVHFQEYENNRDKGLEIIMDSWLASKCDYFIGNGHSNVSQGISELKDWEEDMIKLLY